MRYCSLFMIVGLLFCVASTQAATLVADYQFQNNLNSSVLGAPALVAVGTGTAAFGSETVEGQSRTVYQFTGSATAGGAGLRAETDGLVSPSNYSLVFLARFGLLTGTISKLVDFKNLTSDAGVYNVANIPNFYNATASVAPGTSAFPDNQYAQFALTRTSANVVTAYLNGSQIFQFTDTDGLAVIDDPNSANEYLHLFFDDPNSTIVTAGLSIENPTGAVARLRLYDGALSAAEVGTLDTVPEPAIASSIIVLAALLRRRR